MRCCSFRVVFACLILFYASGSAGAQGDPVPPSLRSQATAPDPIHQFEKIVVKVPMRDGIGLNTEIYKPRNAPGRLPIILWRTPYGMPFTVTRAGTGAAGSIFATRLRALVTDGYIFVFQDIRGRHGSEGQFVLLRPKRRGPDEVDESTDTQDTIDWLLKNVAGHNGRVGMTGLSYPGWLAAVAATDPHPALYAVAPQAPVNDFAMTDDFFHNGAFRLSYAFEWVQFAERSGSAEPFAFDARDTFEWYLKQKTLRKMYEDHIAGKATAWELILAHPTYDEFWRERAMSSHGTSKIPSLLAGGWLDSENRSGPSRIFEHWIRTGASDAHLVMGPWTHGGILEAGGTADYYQYKVLAPWLAKHLKGTPSAEMPPVLLFETGSEKWVSSRTWPTKDGVKRKLYLHADGKISFELPKTEHSLLSYISDPNRPVPYRPRPIESFVAGPGWARWQSNDQRFSEPRPDVLTWTSDPLERDLVVSGSIVANLFASTTGTDVDWVIKLIDVHPEGPETRWIPAVDIIRDNPRALQGQPRRGEAGYPGKDN